MIVLSQVYSFYLLPSRPRSGEWWWLGWNLLLIAEVPKSWLDVAERRWWGLLFKT